MSSPEISPDAITLRMIRELNLQMETITIDLKDYVYTTRGSLADTLAQTLVEHIEGLKKKGAGNSVEKFHEGLFDGIDRINLLLEARKPSATLEEARLFSNLTDTSVYYRVGYIDAIALYQLYYNGITGFEAIPDVPARIMSSFLTTMRAAALGQR